jgi:DNA invertase Pin-like site-specific DNA recombinase
MLIGYARVSKNEQNLDLQRDALIKAGCREKDIFTDKITGTKQERNGLTQALTHLREGDTFVVWRLDRLGRSLKHLIETVTNLHVRNIAFQSITEHIDTATATGQLVFHIFGALAEFERNLIRERTIAGLESARARCRFAGRHFDHGRDRQLPGQPPHEQIPADAVVPPRRRSPAPGPVRRLQR